MPMRGRGPSTALAFAPTTLSFDNYWERVIEPIQQWPWYNTPRPAGREMEFWDARVAMLDANLLRTQMRDLKDGSWESAAE